MDIPDHPLRSHYDRHFFEWQRDGSRRSAAEILPFVFDLCQPQSVCDLGCGSGAWLSVAKLLGATRILGVDGPHVEPSSQLIDPSEFQTHNLEQPLSWPARFDLALCLEVAEHLEPHFAGQIIETLVNAAPVVLFSAATPGQGGRHHVNEQPASYWLRKFEMHAYRAHDCIRPLVWDNPRVDYWYAQNTFLFVHASWCPRFARIANTMRTSGTPFINLIHPRRLLPPYA
jgi:SAM-dependent methyltransferase